LTLAPHPDLGLPTLAGAKFNGNPATLQITKIKYYDMFAPKCADLFGCNILFTGPGSFTPFTPGGHKNKGAKV
jgi:hypothetical protein